MYMLLVTLVDFAWVKVHFMKYIYIYFRAKKLTANEVLDLLLEPDDALEAKNTGEYRVYLQPPEDQNGETDCDDEEDEHDENVKPVNADVLPRRILLATAEVGTKATKIPQIIGMRGVEEDVSHVSEDGKEERSGDEMEGETSQATTIRPQKSRSVGGRGAAVAPTRGGRTARGRARGGRTANLASRGDSEDWSEQDEGKVGTEIPELNFDESNPVWQHLESINIDQPLQFYKEMVPDEFIQQVVDQSVLYAEQNKNKSWAKWQNEVTIDSLRVVEGVMLLSGYNNLPSRRLFWEQRDDVYNKMVAENIR